MIPSYWVDQFTRGLRQKKRNLLTPLLVRSRFALASLLGETFCAIQSSGIAENLVLAANGIYLNARATLN